MQYSDLVRKDTVAKAQKHDISYRCTAPRNAGPVYRKVFFSDDYIAECGWTKGDRIRVVYSQEESALGFKMVTYDEVGGVVRSLTKPNNSREYYIKLVGDIEGLPFIGDRIELKEHDIREDGFTFARFPIEEDKPDTDANESFVVEESTEAEDSSPESDDSESEEDTYDQLNAVEPIDVTDVDESDVELEEMAKDTWDKLKDL